MKMFHKVFASLGLLGTISLLCTSASAGGERPVTRRTTRPAAVAKAPAPVAPQAARTMTCATDCTPRHPTCADLAPERGRRYVSRFPGLRFPQIFGFAPVARFEGGKPLGVSFDHVGSGVSYRGYETDNQIDFEPEITGIYNRMYLLDRNTGVLYADPNYLAARRAQDHFNRTHR